jgi:hypothetical protein
LSGSYNTQNQDKIDQPARVVRLEVSVGYYAELISPTGEYNSTFIDKLTSLSPVQEIYASSEIDYPGFSSEYADTIKPKYMKEPKLSRNAFAFKLWFKSVIWGCGDSCMRCDESYYDLNSLMISGKC